jgi:Cu+-exporting ATPase
MISSRSSTRSTCRKKVQRSPELGWAFVYNVLGIPLAAFGLLSPVVAGAAMALSSVSVVANALLLRRWRPDVLHAGAPVPTPEPTEAPSLTARRA